MSHLKMARRISGFMNGSGTAEFADELRMALNDLKEGVADPCAGVEAVAEFFQADEVFFNMCDDSDGNLGQVFTLDARDLFVHYAAACDDKPWLADRVLRLQHDDDYGVRDCLVDVASRYLPQVEVRDLVERLWTLSRGEQRDYRQRQWLYLIESLARQLHDPKLFAKASLAAWPKGSVAQCIDIARVYFESGDAKTALT